MRVLSLLVCVILPAYGIAAGLASWPGDQPMCVAKMGADRANGCPCAVIGLPPRSTGLWEPEFSADGLRLYFSNAPFGPTTDIFVITRSSDYVPFSGQEAQRLPEAVNSTRSDRAVSVVQRVNSVDHLFFVSERESAGRIYEAIIPLERGIPVLESPISVRRIEGGISKLVVLNVYVYPDEATIITNGPSVCESRFIVARKVGDHTWEVDSASKLVAEINSWADQKDMEEPCGWPCDGSCGLLDPHVTQDGQALYFVRAGDLYRAMFNEAKQLFSGNTVRKISEIEGPACPHAERRQLWLEGPTTHLDASGELWLFYHSAGQHGRIGAYGWPAGRMRWQQYLPGLWSGIADLAEDGRLRPAGVTGW